MVGVGAAGEGLAGRGAGCGRLGKSAWVGVRCCGQGMTVCGEGLSSRGEWDGWGRRGEGAIGSVGAGEAWRAEACRGG